MAFVGTCSVCGATTRKPEDHPECISARRVDLLAQVQATLRQHPHEQLPDELRERILAEKLEPLEVFLRKKLVEFCASRRLGKVASVTFKALQQRVPCPEDLRFAAHGQ